LSGIVQRVHRRECQIEQLHPHSAPVSDACDRLGRHIPCHVLQWTDAEANAACRVTNHDDICTNPRIAGGVLDLWCSSDRRQPINGQGAGGWLNLFGSIDCHNDGVPAVVQRLAYLG
jgi:hypothetical protein